MVSTTAASGAPVLDFSAPGVLTNVGNYSLGWQFYANSSVDVLALLYFDDYGDGLAEAHDVGIYDAGQNLLVSATVSPSDPLVGSAPWRSHAITAVTLTAGQYYWIAGVSGLVDYYTGDGVEGITTSPAITYIQDQFTESAGLAFPADSWGFADAYFGPGFEVSEIPEPATWALISGSLLLLPLARRWRGRRR